MDPRQFLMGSGSPGYSFKTPGEKVVGQIIAEPTLQQQKVYGKEELAFWPSGDPTMQMLVQVQTQLRNYEGIATPDFNVPDSGARTIYVKGKHFEPAVKRAILESGAKWLDVGGWIEVQYVGEDMNSKAGQKPKLFNVRYQPPAPGSQPAQRQPAPPVSAYTADMRQTQAQQPQGQPNWQQPGWQAPPAQQFHQQGMDRIVSNMPQSAVPSHHGQPDQIPAWAAQASAPPAPAPTSAPPALSTLDMLKAGMSDQAGFGTEEPPF